MVRQSSLLMMAMALFLAGAELRGQSGGVRSSEAGAFIGTWVFTMTNPPGTQETVRIIDRQGMLAASVQAGRFPPIDVSGVLKDGDMLVLTATRFENGKPIRAVISLVPQDETMKIGQMLEFSETIKRGLGKKQ